MAVQLKSTLTFSDEQSMLLDTATEFFRDKSTAADVRNQIETEQGFAENQWQEMVALGWTGLAIPEEYGGSDLGLAAAVCIAEPMGRHLSATPLLSTQLFVQGLRSASDSQKSKYLTAIAEGASGTVALCEEDGNWNLASTDFDIAVSGDRASLSGSKSLVLDAHVAGYLLVSGRCNGEVALGILEADDLDRSSVKRETVIDETRRSFSIEFDAVTIPRDRLITGDAAKAALTAIRNAALLLISAESAGGIAGVLDVILAYLNTRSAFGRKIGGYQALKHPSVDILIGLERSRSHLYHAASLMDAGEDAEVALRMAKAQSSDAFAFAGDRAVQFHGGFGFTYECDAQLFLRRALWTQYAYGDAAHHRKHLAELIL